MSREFWLELKRRAYGQRPRTLPEARAWATEKLINSRNANFGVMLGRRRVGVKDPVAYEKTNAARHNRIHQAAQSVLAQWEKTKRPPKGFRRRLADAPKPKMTRKRRGPIGGHTLAAWHSGRA